MPSRSETLGTAPVAVASGDSNNKHFHKFYTNNGRVINELDLLLGYDPINQLVAP